MHKDDTHTLDSQKVCNVLDGINQPSMWIALTQNRVSNMIVAQSYEKYSVRPIVALGIKYTLQELEYFHIDFISFYDFLSFGQINF